MELLPKSHLAGALQRAMGRNEVYKSEMLFFHRTDETGEKHYALLRIPALPKKKPDGTNYIPTQPFAYYEGYGPTREEAEDYAARKALHQIRQADSEITRWLSWAASTSKQALELASNEIADARPTDGLSRMWMSRALQEFHGRPIRKFETPFYMRQDEYSGAYHAVLTLPWKASTKRKAPLKYFFEGTGLEPLLAKESAAEAAFKILGPIAKVKRKDGPAELTKPLRDVVSNEKVPAKIRLHQLMEHVLRRTGREPNRRRDFVYATKPVVENDTELLFEVWQSNTTEVTLTMPSLELDSEPLRYSIRVPSWVRPRKEVGKDRRFRHVRKRYWDAKDEERKAFTAAQQEVAEVALKDLLSMPLPVFEEQERRLEERRRKREERMRKLPEASTSFQEEGNPQPSSEQRSEELGAAVRLPVEADSV